MRKLMLGLAALATALASPAGATPAGKVLLYGGAGQGKVIFDGRLHASKGYGCKSCHADIFPARKKALISMDDHGNGKACFACHDGTTASFDCQSCHRDVAAATKQPPVRIHGAASVFDSVIVPYRSAVEKSTGMSLAVEKNNAGKGMKELAEGKCEVAMVSASLEASLAAAKSAGLEKAPSNLQMHLIATSEVVFVVHPSNPVKRLSWDQLKDVHTGKITNWKQLGGKDQPIVVYTDAAASATRGLIKQVVMGNSDYAPAAKAVGFVKEVNDRVAQDEAGVGALGLEFADPKQVTVVQTKKVERPLAFVTVGPPTEAVQKIIDGFRAEAKASAK
jgi:phosphate transport system substrate-binding protein